MVMSGYYDGPPLTIGVFVRASGILLTELSGFSTANYLEATAQGSLNITGAAGTIAMVWRLTDLTVPALTETLLSHCDAGAVSGWFFQIAVTAWAWASGDTRFFSTGIADVPIGITIIP